MSPRREAAREERRKERRDGESAHIGSECAISVGIDARPSDAIFPVFTDGRLSASGCGGMLMPVQRAASVLTSRLVSFFVLFFLFVFFAVGELSRRTMRALLVCAGASGRRGQP